MFTMMLVGYAQTQKKEGLIEQVELGMEYRRD